MERATSKGIRVFFFLLSLFYSRGPSPSSDPWNQVRHCVYFVLRWIKLYEIANIDHSWPTKRQFHMI